jgi:hypothetical protein
MWEAALRRVMVHAHLAKKEAFFFQNNQRKKG